MTPGYYQERSVGGEMWRYHALSWSSFWRFPTTDAWHVSVNENTHGLGNGFSLAGTCTRPPKHFWCGQRHMMREVWTSGADNVMTSGSVHCPVPSSASKGSTASKNNLLC